MAGTFSSKQSSAEAILADGRSIELEMFAEVGEQLLPFFVGNCGGPFEDFFPDGLALRGCCVMAAGWRRSVGLLVLQTFEQ